MIKYFKEPFDHAIIYDHFDEIELANIKKEIKTIHSSKIDNDVFVNDDHHLRLIKDHSVTTYDLDCIYNNDRNQSDILTYITKVYHMAHQGVFDVKKFRNLEYIKYSNVDNTMLHGYINGSDYYRHHDQSVLSFLYVFWDEPKPFTGGDLIFDDYIPELKSNCCLIFPSYEMHRVSKVITKNDGIVRWSINQRIFIKD